MTPTAPQNQYRFVLLLIMICTCLVAGVAAADEGGIWAWGWNNNGQLGDNTTTQSSDPVQVTGLERFDTIAIAAGNAHSLALASNGEVIGWGWNFFGQLGDISGTDRHTPVPVSWPVEIDIIAIDAYGDHSLALASDGSVWAWGRNNAGQLGLGDTFDRSAPVRVAGLGDRTITAIAAGSAHSLALDSEGSVWAWGRNSNGQLGDGTTARKTSPIQVPGVGSITAIGAGSDHSIAVGSGGAVWAWGRNQYGQLGDNTTSQRTTPVQVKGPDGDGSLTGIASVDAGAGHTLAVASDGSVWAWGWNTAGQLGDG